ncbi:Arylsulfatase [Maioricimonas rarisocia]|uniref:Arylsulfatase n=1 Tax=Maioricimonas rarisocia TaxID=2528026 RepID=A0A517Z9J2_9PLAN|nr:sulfatase [Maioricimonas rarisocia]QDU39155.1 Arylsulfatase [Maioricimonas rarisocia]
MIRLAFALCLALFLSATLRADDTKSPHNGRNVILFVVDDQGFQAGCYGNKEIKTPNIDRLAATGVRFTRASCTSASCSASRSVLLTGLHNHATGHYGHAHAYHHFSTYDTVKTLPVMLSEAGYRTCSIGKYHLAPEYVYHFEEYRNQGIVGGARNSVMMAQNAIDWMKEEDERPFFLYFCTSDPHRGPGPGNFANFNNREENPYPGCERITYNPDDITPPPWLPDNDEVRKELAEYYQAISRLDQGLGLLLDYLNESGREKETLVIFLSDNGPPFPGAKTNLYQPGMNLPLLVRDPDVEKQGSVCDARVTWVDIVPTILDFCDVTPEPAPPIRPKENVGPPEYRQPPRKQKLEPVTFHGRSFLDILGKASPEGWDEAFASHTFHEITMYYPMRVIIDGDHKLLFNIAHQLPYPFASDLYASPTWQSVLNSDERMYGPRTVDSYIYRPRFELYNLAEDPWETNNLATDSSHQEVLEKLQEKLRKWQNETRDPWKLKWTYE